MDEYTIVWHTASMLNNVTKIFNSFAEAQTWAEVYAPAYGQHWSLERGRVVNETRVTPCYYENCYGEVHDDSPCTNCGG